jgi:hypothetical protein
MTRFEAPANHHHNLGNLSEFEIRIDDLESEIDQES